MQVMRPRRLLLRVKMISSPRPRINQGRAPQVTRVQFSLVWRERPTTREQCLMIRRDSPLKLGDSPLIRGDSPLILGKTTQNQGHGPLTRGDS